MSYDYCGFVMRLQVSSLKDITGTTVVEPVSAADLRARVARALQVPWPTDGTLVVDGLYLNARNTKLSIQCKAEPGVIERVACQLAAGGFGIFDSQTLRVVAQPDWPKNGR